MISNDMASSSKLISHIDREINALESLPLADQLDPCCQKELETLKKASVVNRQLRAVDRTYERFDIQQKLFADTKRVDYRMFSCYCCAAEKEDYEALARIRLPVNKGISSSGLALTSDDANDSLSDSESEDDELMKSLQEIQQEQLQSERKKIEQRLLMGYLKHKEDSVSHLSQLIKNGELLILHAYFETSELDAQLDLFFENIAPRYQGSKFRRIAFNTESVNFFNQCKVSSSVIDDAFRRKCGIVIIFSNQGFKTCQQIEYFCSDSELLETEVMSFLNNTNSLQVSFPERLLENIERKNYYDEENETMNVDDGEEERFCEDPDCTKRYPHEHVGRGYGATFARNDPSAEILAKNTFQRL